MSNAVVALLKAKLNEETELTAGLEAALSRMEMSLAAVCENENKRLEEDLKRVVAGGGKRLRPALSWLGYQIGKADKENADAACPEEQDGNTKAVRVYPVIPLMMAVELVHTSSLIHDDIVDKASVRRSVPTINATSGDFAAVQAGDYLLSKATLTVREYEGLEIEKQFGSVARAMCLAEFLQIETANKWNADSLSNYFTQITNKTARFLSAAVALGGKAGGASEGTVKVLEDYGLNIGMAFQIRDDVLDFASDDGFGKKCGIDLERGLFTLPLILALQKEPASEEERSRLETARKKAVAKEKSKEDIEDLLQFVKGSGALKEAQFMIEKYTNEAQKTMEPFQNTAAGAALIVLADSLAVRGF